MLKERTHPHVWRAGIGDEEIEVLIVDDHWAVRSAIEALIGGTPGINGVEATGEICRSMAAPAVVVFSGSRELWREARAAGATHTVLKDEDPQKLVEAIRDAAGR